MDLNARKATLAARREAIVADLARIRDELDAPLPQEWGEAAVEQEDDEVLQALGNAEQVELRRIDAALRRMEEGEYGFCTRCGDTVQPARLDLLPDTPFCAGCAPRG
ncbi:TraR/DksA C4-type zinc finger protein [Paracoccus sp. PS-1]|uniref:TraR/DksA family transcriptional regulator n=1 Tax=unclassified Paracoccus (in: a-proteobacteria) TaxID=2688777 RepID=UPI00048D329A|nr:MULTISPECIES: TraR/DksA C4-type zinc finger protein [unclassified Paracoccus (in: a-proteobacteria)]MDQ7261018.1 TraR/DksA C4-type zinc finger protein [Paracoccus sp. PS1]